MKLPTLIYKYLLLAGLLSGISGCSLPATLAPPTTAEPASPSSATLLHWAANQPVGAYALLDDPLWGKGLAVTVEAGYLAASGLACKRLRVESAAGGGPGETLAACRDHDQQWFIAPRIWGGRP